MLTMTGTIESIDPMDHGARAGVSIRQADGRTGYVRVTVGGNDVLLARLGAARTAQDVVRIECEPLPLRLGMPAGEITAVLPLAA